MVMLLSLMILVPLATAAFVMLIRLPGLVRWASLLGTLATLVLALLVAAQFREAQLSSVSAAGPIRPRVEIRHTWMTVSLPRALTGAAADLETPVGQSGGGRRVLLEYYVGLDGISLLLVVLTALLMVSCVLVSWQSVGDRDASFHACLLVLESALLGAFSALDVLSFFVFCELALWMLLLLIGVRDGAQRHRVRRRFLICMLPGSVLTLIGLGTLVLGALAHSESLETPLAIPALALHLSGEGVLPYQLQFWIFLGLASGFVIKTALFPFHTWMPPVHTEMPTAGLVVLVGVSLKLGAYGFLRLCLPLLPDATLQWGVPLIGTLAVIGILKGAICAVVQQDLIKLLAYGSVSHLGLCLLGMLALNTEGLSGSVLQMVNHGLSTGALLLLVGMLHERYQTRIMSDLGGLAARLPVLACMTIFFCFSSAGLPGLNGFVGQVLCLIGMFKFQVTFAVLAGAGVVLGAWYLFAMVQRTLFGPLKEPAVPGAAVRDLSFRELAALAPLAVLCLGIGVYPKPVLNLIRPDVQAVARIYEIRTDRPQFEPRNVWVRAGK